MFDGGGVYFAVDFLLHHSGKLGVADQFDDNFHHGVIQNFLLNLLVEIAFLPTLHLAVLAAVIRERLGENTFVKIPTTPQGLKAMKTLAPQGVNITATAIYTPMQAFLAAKAGAKYTAPYINRIDNFGYNGVQVAMDIQDIFENNNLPCEVLAASFKNSQQVLELTKYGIGAATIGCEVIENLIKNKAIDAAIDVFNSDFASITGEGKTMADC